MPERRRDDPIGAAGVLLCLAVMTAFLTLWLLGLRDKERARADRTEWRIQE